MNRPEFCTEEMLDFLDDLRESGSINMFGAGRELDDAFPELSEGLPSSFHSSDKARKVLQYWMDSFGSRSQQHR